MVQSGEGEGKTVLRKDENIQRDACQKSVVFDCIWGQEQLCGLCDTHTVRRNEEQEIELESITSVAAKSENMFVVNCSLQFLLH